jgi:hypothetical protein
MMNDRNMRARFWAKVNKNGPVVREELGACWVWTAARMKKNGYGRFGVRSRNTLAHRFSWELTHRREPTLFVLHHCDNRACVRPSHLYEGTSAQNAADMVNRGRCKSFGHTWVNGPLSPNAKLTEKQVLELRERASRGEEGTVLALVFGITKQTVSKIIRRKRWAWLR